MVVTAVAIMSARMPSASSVNSAARTRASASVRDLVEGPCQLFGDELEVLGEGLLRRGGVLGVVAAAVPVASGLVAVETGYFLVAHLDADGGAAAGDARNPDDPDGPDVGCHLAVLRQRNSHLGAQVPLVHSLGWHV